MACRNVSPGTRFDGRKFGRNTLDCRCCSCSALCQAVSTPRSLGFPPCRSGPAPQKLRPGNSTIHFPIPIQAHQPKAILATTIGRERRFAGPPSSDFFREFLQGRNPNLSPAPHEEATAGNHRCKPQSSDCGLLGLHTSQVSLECNVR